MKKLQLSGVAFIATVGFCFAQDINQVKKVIDAEQYEKAKSMLKSIVASNPTDGQSSFLLGNIYLTQAVNDSAKIAYEKGLSAKSLARLNNIGLGALNLESGNEVAAEDNFATALKDVKKKDIEELISIGRAYTNSSKPNFKKALEYLNKAKAINPNDAGLLLAFGDAYYGDKNQNDAYLSYRTAFQTDPSLLRAKMQLGVLLKGAKSFDEAIKAYDEVIALNPSYGPVYRELAETYYKWARNKPSKSAEYMNNAKTNYEKYLSFTDKSLHSRMRYADFLILVKDYQALQVEASAMSQMDKVNPRIFRYLGYAAYENNNADLAIQSVEKFIASPANKVIAMDYWYLGLAKIKKGTSTDGSSIDQTFFSAGLADLKKSLEMEPLIVDDFNEVGRKLFSAKLYKEAASIFEFGTTNVEYKNYVEDNVYCGLALYYDNYKKGAAADKLALQRSDEAFAKVIAARPAYADGYLYRARTASLLDNDELTIKYYEEFLAKVAESGPEELAKPATLKKVTESYNTIGASYANTDKVKAVEYFNKTLTVDAANAYAKESLTKLK